MSLYLQRMYVFHTLLADISSCQVGDIDRLKHFLRFILDVLAGCTEYRFADTYVRIGSGTRWHMYSRRLA